MYEKLDRQKVKQIEASLEEIIKAFANAKYYNDVTLALLEQLHGITPLLNARQCTRVLGLLQSDLLTRKAAVIQHAAVKILAAMANLLSSLELKFTLETLMDQEFDEFIGQGMIAILLAPNFNADQQWQFLRELKNKSNDDDSLQIITATAHCFSQKQVGFMLKFVTDRLDESYAWEALRAMLPKISNNLKNTFLKKTLIPMLDIEAEHLPQALTLIAAIAQHFSPTQTTDILRLVVSLISDKYSYIQMKLFNALQALTPQLPSEEKIALFELMSSQFERTVKFDQQCAIGSLLVVLASQSTAKEINALIDKFHQAFKQGMHTAKALAGILPQASSEQIKEISTQLIENLHDKKLIELNLKILTIIIPRLADEQIDEIIGKVEKLKSGENPWYLNLTIVSFLNHARQRRTNLSNHNFFTTSAIDKASSSQSENRLNLVLHCKAY